MSGGAFNYEQYAIDRIAREIEQVVMDNFNDDLDEYGDTKGRFFPEDVMARLMEAIKCLRRAYIYAHRVDWMLSGDDSEESFISRLAMELEDDAEDFLGFNDDIMEEIAEHQRRTLR